MKPEIDVYNIYCGKCKDNNVNPINQDEFCKLWNVSKKVIDFYLDKNNSEPWIASEIDDTFILYHEVQKGKLVSNVWTRDEYKFLLGKKI